MKTALFVALSLLSLPSIGRAQCADLKGAYTDCQLVGGRDEKFTFQLSRGFKLGDSVYRATGTREGSTMTVPFLADAQTRALHNDRNEALAPIPLEYVAACDPNQLIVSVTSVALGAAAVEKFFISKSPEGNLVIKNQSLILGRQIAAREIVCKKAEASAVK
jgi:hypothetical protein